MRTHLEHARIVADLLAPVFDRLRSAEPNTFGIMDPGVADRVLARDAVAALPLPPFDNSQMDGFAVRTADFAGAGPWSLPIGGTIAAGDAPGQHGAGTAMPIMTGAAIPRGADAVIPVEAAEPPTFAGAAAPDRGSDVPHARFAARPAAGAFVRARGSDHDAQRPLVAAGTRLRPAVIGLLAHGGVTEVSVLPRLRVLLITTGDEVVPPGSSRGDGQIFDANGALLAAALRGAGASVTLRSVSDRAEHLRSILHELILDHDLLVTSGGVSAGAFEVVKDALGGPGSDVAFTSVALQPGGPQGAGRVELGGGSIVALCFPGNPVSSALSAELFLLPLLRDHAAMPSPSRESATLAHDVASPVQKHQVRRGRFDETGAVHLTPPSSHLLADLADAELLAHIPVGVAHLPAGSPIEIQRFHG